MARRYETLARLTNEYRAELTFLETKKKALEDYDNREKQIEEYIKVIRDLQTDGLKKKWHLIRFSRLSVINGGRAKGVPRKGGTHGRKWAYIVHPSKTN